MKKIILLSVTASALLAVQPNISDIQKEVAKPKLPQKSVKLPQIDVELKEPLKSFDTKTKYIKGYQISGNKHISNYELQMLIQDYNEKELTFDEVNTMATKITKYYRNKGYFVARAYIPKQQMKEDILEIAIIEGNYGKFVLDNKSLVKTNVVQGMLDDVKKYNIVSTDTLERAMLIINDQAGVVVTSAEVMPGEIVGTSDFAIKTEATSKTNGYAMIDNYGSAYTGRYRLNGGVYLNSPLSLGDRLSLSGLITKNKGLSNARAGYEVPIMPNGLKLNTSASKTTYKLGDTYSALDAIGNSKTYDLGLTYPFIRTSTQNLNLYTTLTYKDLKDDVQSTSTTTKKKIKSLKVGFNFDKLFLNSNILINSYLTNGYLTFDDDTAKAIDSAGANTNGRYSKINLDILHNYTINEQFSLSSKLNLQSSLNHKNLDGSEDMTISGSDGVKAYQDSEQSGEKGYLVGTELFYTLPNNLGKTSIFYDIGTTYMSDNTNVSYQNRTLQDMGLGYYGNYQNLNYTLIYARGIGGTVATSETDRASRVLCNINYSF